MIEGPIQLTVDGLPGTLLAYRKKDGDGFVYCTVGKEYARSHGLADGDIEAVLDRSIQNDDVRWDPEFKAMMEGLFDVLVGGADE